MTAKIIGTSELLLPTHGTIRRRAPRTPEKQQPNYMELFDSQTVFCDVFQSGDTVTLIGPPLLNLAPIFTEANWFADGEQLAPLETLALNRAQRSHLATEGPVDTLRVDYGEYSSVVTVRSDQNHLLEGRRVLLAMQRNNPLDWLKEWASVYASVNQVDAIVLYDLHSRHYTEQDLLEALSGVRGIEAVIVVPWPYKYGVQPWRAGDPWDSDFGQYVAWEHARRRFLMKAAAVTVSDVDEIFLAEDGRSIFEHAAESGTGIVRFKQRFIEPRVVRDPTDSPQISYADYFLYDPNREVRTPKYAVILNQLQDHHQLLVHSVGGDYSPETDEILGRQFEAMKLAWQRGTFDRKHPDLPALGAELTEDVVLRRAIERSNVPLR